VRLVAQRIASLGFVLVGMTCVMFWIANLLPGDAARAAAGGADATPEMVEAARHRLGLDRPLPVQYAIYVKNLLHGDLGESFVTRRSIWEDLRQYYPATIELALYAIAVTSVIGIPVGVWLAITRRTAARLAGEGLSLVGTSLPGFWFGLILILVFYGALNWLPAGGRLDFTVLSPPAITGIVTLDALLLRRFDLLGDAVRHLVLPVVVQGAVMIGYVIRLTRDAVHEIQATDFARTARAKGLPEPIVLLKHVLKNAAPSIVTMLGLLFGMVLSGAIVIETVFAWPGVGRYAAQAIDNKDFPAILGFATTFSLLYALVNLVTDVICALLRPKGA